jgi:hypothetical protein
LRRQVKVLYGRRGASASPLQHEQADRERRALQNTGRKARRIRGRLDKLEIMEDSYSEQQAEGLISIDRLRSKLAALGEERSDLERRLAELADSEQRLRELEALPELVVEYLRDLPHLLAQKPVVREYETVGVAVPSEENPLGGLYTLTPERIRMLPEEELAQKRRAAEEKRAQRFRELYAMLNLGVVCHKDRSLVVTWGVHCHEWLGRGPTPVGTTLSMMFRATIRLHGGMEVEIRL